MLASGQGKTPLAALHSFIYPLALELEEEKNYVNLCVVFHHGLSHGLNNNGLSVCFITFEDLPLV